MSVKFGKTKETEGLLKLTKFGAAMLIFGDIRPHQYLEKQPKYGNLLRRRHFGAKKRLLAMSAINWNLNLNLTVIMAILHLPAYLDSYFLLHCKVYVMTYDLLQS